ncbi:hypothetical protein SAMN04487950_3286 [Halogranum rubrum]|uniref:Uncharacterized protein n=1 Tax=Halogranum rubrum TaxID=553466 RepID=A0A1I4GGV3_9EURY|nr:hypothetical protein [Halogranum rubrum]SFL29079.1 hypothetical protein SAMN04487950_3286 [Halogranum rubrum]
MSYRLQSAVGSVVESVGASERRRVLVALGIPLLFWLTVELAANLGFLPLVLAVGLAAYLYTRETEQETLAAGFAGVGLLLASLFLLQLYWVGATGSTEPLADAATRLSGWLLTGVVLLGLGYWLYRVEV